MESCVILVFRIQQMQLTVCFVPEQTRIVIGEASGSNTLAKAKKMRSQSMDRANQVEAMGPEKKKKRIDVRK